MVSHNSEDRIVSQEGLEIEAIKRLNELFSRRSLAQFGPDLLLKCFRDLVSDSSDIDWLVRI